MPFQRAHLTESARDLYDFLDHLSKSFPVAWEPVSWILETYLRNDYGYKLEDAVNCELVPLLN
jgi:hypothetical protein